MKKTPRMKASASDIQDSMDDNSVAPSPDIPGTEEEEDNEAQAQERRRRGRPRSIERKVAGASNGRHASDENKEGKHSKETFFNRLKQLSEDDWDRYQIYVYRRWPRITLTDKPHYIGVHRTPVDEEFIRSTYGSGRYALRLNDAKGTVDSTGIEIQDLSHPPKVAADELIDCNENARYYKLWPAEAKKKAADGANGNDSAVKELAGVLKMVLEKKDAGKDDDEAKKAVSSLIDWALRQKDAERAESSPTALANLLKELKGILPTPAPVTAPAPQTDMAALLRLAKELQPPPPPPAPNPLQLLEQAKGLFSPPQDDLANIDRLLSIANKLAAIRGGGEGQRSGWDVGLDYLRELSPLAQYFANVFGLRMSGMTPPSAPGAAPGTAAAAPAAFDPYQRPDLLRQHAQMVNGFAAAQAAAAAAPGAMPSTAAPPPGAQANGMPAGAAPSNDLLATFQMYGGLVVQALNGGVPGYDFADHIVALTGNATHAVISAHGEDALVDTMKQIPEIGLFGEPRLRTFVREFLNYEQYLEQAEEEEDEPEQHESPPRKAAVVA
jgi:hypothetical protein